MKCPKCGKPMVECLRMGHPIWVCFMCSYDMPRVPAVDTSSPSCPNPLPNFPITEETKLQTPADYSSLRAILNDAFDQASIGKGKDRHANDKPFGEQPIMVIRGFGLSFCTGQAVKKIIEAQNLPWSRARAELLGAINYLAAEIIYMDKEDK